ncbi:DUF2341 domain-containing protein [Alloalcanivorax xenomutans]|uniref:DUF2341 domain-containing protein n=1 Tax=Alloalcanivorax xenomutans TaxID=1094342 RepID=UPI003BAB383F
MQQRLLIFLISCLGALLPTLAHAWWQDDWSYRKQITIDTSPQGAAIDQRVGRVPLLVRLHTGNFSFQDVQENGSDLRFVAADDQTVLNHQIESFDALLGVAYIWVDVPALEAGSSQDIWMYYGNPDAPATSNGQAVFDADYTLVYHFDQALGAPARDATAYGNNSSNTVAQSVTGVIGQAAAFAGGEPLMVEAAPSLATPAAGQFSFSAWVRADQNANEQLIYARRDAGNSLLIGINAGQPFVEINGQRTAPAQPLASGQWQHLAVTADGQQVALYVNGRQISSLPVALPPLATAIALGGDIPGYAPAAPVAEETASEGEDVATTTPAAVPSRHFNGALDEVRISKQARPASLLMADYQAQGSESRLVVFGVDEEQSGFGFGALGFLLSAVPIDAWVIIGILVIMMIQTWFVMYRKFRHTRRVDEANGRFRDEFAQVGTQLEKLADSPELERELEHSSLWRLYEVAVHELRLRRAQGADTSSISSETLEAIRASMDAVRTQQNRELSSRLGVLSNAIAGGPYIGLLGTVMGIMVVFLGTAMAGDVNINAVAPGMAAALLATAMGLFVAIPALFAYNRINGRNRDISSDMRVFLDEFVTRLAEIHGAGQRPPQPAQAGHAVRHGISQSPVV